MKRVGGRRRDLSSLLWKSVVVRRRCCGGRRVHGQVAGMPAEPEILFFGDGSGKEEIVVEKVSCELREYLLGAGNFLGLVVCL